MRARRIIAVVAAFGVGTVGMGSAGLAPAGAAACYTGTWNLTDTSATRTIKTPYGLLGVTPRPGGAVRLTITPDGTWSLDVDKSFFATGTGALGTASGTVTVDAVASGLYRARKNGSVVFRIRSGSGNANFAGTVNGAPLSYAYSIVKSDVQRYLGIKGKAVPTCNGGSLSLRFNTVTLRF